MSPAVLLTPAERADLLAAEARLALAIETAVVGMPVALAMQAVVRVTGAFLCVRARPGTHKSMMKVAAATLTRIASHYRRVEAGLPH